MSASIRALVAALACAGALVVIPQALADSTFTDPAGDAGGAPDITQVVVSDAVGKVSFRVTCTLVPSSEVAVFLDTDRDGTSDYVVATGMEANGSKYYAVYKRSGSSFDQVQGSSVTAGSVPGGFEIVLTQSAFGISGSFAFDLESDLYNGDAVVATDYAPDGALPWSYALAAQAPKPAPAPAAVTAVVGKPAARPARPTAGHRLTVVFPVTRSDTGAAVSGAQTGALASVAGKKVAVRVTLAGGKAVVTLTPPPGSHGKRLVVTVGVMLGGTATVRAYTATVA